MRSVIALLLAGFVCVSLVLPATVSADVEDDVEELIERVDDLELKTSKNKISFFGDFRVRYDYMKWHIPAYNQFMGMNFTDPMNPVPVYMPVAAQDLENSEAWSAGRGSSEETRIREVLTRFDGNRTLAARALGMSRTTLWRKLKSLGLT